jgi:hypothetical protein
LQQEEPVKSSLFASRSFIMGYGGSITEAWRYSMPFYCYNGKRFCYVWAHKKLHQPYIGIVDGNKISHPGLLAEKRSRMKILLIDPEKDLPVNTINAIFTMALKLYN